MTKQKSSIAKLLTYAGGYRKLTILGCSLSAAAAVLVLGPFICIWLVIREIFVFWPEVTAAQHVSHYGQMAVWLALASLLVYFAALMCTHLAAFRTARNMRMQAMRQVVELPLGYFSDK